MTATNKYSLLLCFALVSTSLLAQDGLYLTGISSIRQRSYRYRSDASRWLLVEKNSLFDTSKVLTAQQAEYYRESKGEISLSRRALTEYNPKTMLGTTFNEDLSDNSRTKIEFKSFDHEDKRLWVKQYDNQGKLKSESRYQYDNQGYLTRSEYDDKVLKNVHIDEIQRNPLGHMLKWEAYDEDNERGREKVREMNYRYLKDDSSLVTSAGYVYNNWNENEYSYDKKGQIKSHTAYAGIYTGSKVQRDDKTINTYKDGKIQKIVRYELGKKVATTTFKYGAGTIEETTTKGKEKTILLTKEIYFDSLLNKRQILRNGQLEYQLEYQRSNGILIRKIETEFKNNGDRWDTRIDYDQFGNPIMRSFSINQKPQQVDEYYYERFPAPETEPEKED